MTKNSSPEEQAEVSKTQEDHNLDSQTQETMETREAEETKEASSSAELRKGKQSLLTKLYNKCLELASHRHSERWLYFYSFTEAIFMPLPVDILLAPVAMQKKDHWLRIGFLVTVFSIIGGSVGYFLGHFLQEVAQQFILYISSQHTYDRIVQWFAEDGVFAIFMAAATPLPFKVFAITFGIFNVSFWQFALYSFVARWFRFSLVSFLFARYGDRYRTQIERFINRAGWYILLACVLALLLYKFL